MKKIEVFGYLKNRDADSILNHSSGPIHKPTDSLLACKICTDKGRSGSPIIKKGESQEFHRRGSRWRLCQPQKQFRSQTHNREKESDQLMGVGNYWLTQLG